jgi:ATP-dependent exoDNAse (exonuclease V) alpha subunit
MNKWEYIDTSKYKNVDDFEMSDEQLSLLDNVCNNDIVLLTGSAGGGKTSSVKALIKMLDDYNKSYTLLSFSGKASRVLSEATNRTATTIHLKCLRDGEIDSDVILIDEFTMTSLDTFCMLLSCVTNENAKFVFVGDVAQLPAISLGKLFKDMLDSEKVPTTKLTKIFRYSSNGMLYGATNTRQGRPFLYDDIVKNENNTYKIGNNFEFIALETEQIKDEVVKQYQKLLSKGVKKQDIMICTPMNKGDIGTIELNNTLQAEFNPPKPNELILTRKYGQKNIVFRVGDIVLNCKNDYKAVSYDAWQMIGKVDDDPWNDSSYGGNLTEDDVADKIVMNGQLGVVREIIENEGMLVQFDEDLIFVNKGKINHMLLGYAISVHRSQGSTVNYTINIISEQHSRMLNRNLEYVAITRSREKTICIGNISAFDDCLRIEANDYRDTYLKDLLLSIDNVA